MLQLQQLSIWCQCWPFLKRDAQAPLGVKGRCRLICPLQSNTVLLMLVARQIRPQKNFRHSLLVQVSLWRSHWCVTRRAVRPQHPNNGASSVPQFIHTVSLQENISVWRYGQWKSTTWRLKLVWADFFPANVIVILETTLGRGSKWQDGRN